MEKRENERSSMSEMVPMTMCGILHKLNFNTRNTWVISMYCTLYAVSLHSTIRLNKAKVSIAALSTVLFYSSEKIFNLCTRCTIKAEKNEPERKKRVENVCTKTNMGSSSLPLYTLGLYSNNMACVCVLKSTKKFNISWRKP
jgi:hypothetical protein